MVAIVSNQAKNNCIIPNSHSLVARVIQAQVTLYFDDDPTHACSPADTHPSLFATRYDTIFTLFRAVVVTHFPRTLVKISCVL